MSAVRGLSSEPLSIVIETDDAALRHEALQLLAGTDACSAKVIVVLHSTPAAMRLTAIQATVERAPEALVVAAMPADSNGSLLRRALRAGAQGLVLDGDLEATLAPTVRAAIAGQLAVPLTLRKQLARPALSFREKQILSLVVSGYTNRQIANELFVAESTVKTHLSSAFAKLDARSRAEAAALILDPEEGYGPSILDLTAAARQHAA